MMLLILSSYFREGMPKYIPGTFRSTESVKTAIGKDIELEFVKKVKLEYKGERIETRVLVSH